MIFIAVRRTHEEFLNLVKIKNPTVKVLGEYINSDTKIKVNYSECNHTCMIRPARLLMGVGCPLCNKSVLKTQEEFEDQVGKINPNIKIIGKYQGLNHKIKCKCLLDGYEWDVSSGNLLSHYGCPVCSGHKTVKGINDILTTHSWIKPYLVNIDDGFKYSHGSHTKILFKCPDCGNIRSLEIKSVITQGFSCTICGDGISYPNKFARAVLSQFPINNLIHEFNSEWTKKYFYDNYFEYNNNKYVLEMDGGFHFKDNKMNNSSKEDVQNIDKIKDQLAKENNVQMIRIDCKLSDFDYIKNSILNSKLSDIFDLDCIDWNKCENFARSNFLKTICTYYEKYKAEKTKTEIARKFGIHIATLLRYIKIGLKANFISSDITEKEKYNLISKKMGKTVKVVNLLTNDCMIFNSVTQSSKSLEENENNSFKRRQIYDAISRKNGIYKNYQFTYIT